MAKKKQRMEAKEIIEEQVVIQEIIKEEIIEVVDKNPLHTKYEKFINQAKEGYVIGFEYTFAMEILRWCENKRHQTFGLNMSCAVCLINLIKMFDSLREE